MTSVLQENSFMLFSWSKTIDWSGIATGSFLGRKQTNAAGLVASYHSLHADLGMEITNLYFLETRSSYTSHVVLSVLIELT